MEHPDLTLIVFGPAVAALGLFFIRRDDRVFLTQWGVSCAVLPFLYSLKLLGSYNPFDPAMQSLTREGMRNWIVLGDRLRIEYLMGVDGISLFMVLLTTFIAPLAILSAYTSVSRNYREYLFALLALETTVLGSFVALDLVLFFVFWTLAIVPLFFLIGFRDAGDRVKTATKFAVYSLAGSVPMLVAILVLYSISDTHTFNITALYTDPGVLKAPLAAQGWLFWGFFLAFAVRIPLFPLHTWLPDTASDSPAPVNVFINALFVKVGVYGLIRYCLPLFPDAARMFSPAICILAVIGIIYGAWVAIAQRDLIRLIAYFSISHLGIVVLGIFTFTVAGITGAVLHSVSHGLFIAALIIIVGMIQERYRTTRIPHLGGLIKALPMLGAIFWIAAFAAIGLPGLSGFVGQFMVFLGTFEAGAKGSPLFMTLGVIAVTAVIWLAISMLRAFQRVMLGSPGSPSNAVEGKVRDLNYREAFAVIPIIVLLIYIGIFSAQFTVKMTPCVQRTLTMASATHIATPVQTSAGESEGLRAPSPDDGEDTSSSDSPEPRREPPVPPYSEGYEGENPR